MTMRKFINLVENTNVLTEAWDKTVDVYGLNIDVFRNPSHQEFFRLLKQYADEHKTPDQPMRAEIEWPSTDLLIWDSYLAVHADIAQSHYNTSQVFLYLYRDHVMMNDINYNYDEGDDGDYYGESLIRRAEMVLNHPCLRRIYGANMKVMMHDNGSSPREKHLLTPELLMKIKATPVYRLSEL